MADWLIDRPPRSHSPLDGKNVHAPHAKLPRDAQKCIRIHFVNASHSRLFVHTLHSTYSSVVSMLVVESPVFVTHFTYQLNTNMCDMYISTSSMILLAYSDTHSLSNITILIYGELKGCCSIAFQSRTVLLITQPYVSILPKAVKWTILNFSFIETIQIISRNSYSITMHFKII